MATCRRTGNSLAPMNRLSHGKWPMWSICQQATRGWHPATNEESVVKGIDTSFLAILLPMDVSAVIKVPYSRRHVVVSVAPVQHFDRVYSSRSLTSRSERQSLLKMRRFRCHQSIRKGHPCIIPDMRTIALEALVVGPAWPMIGCPNAILESTRIQWVPRFGAPAGSN